MGARRFVYNKVLEKIKGGEDIDFYKLRNKYVTAKNNPLVEEWELETPKDIRAGAIRDVLKNYKTAFTLLKNRQIGSFKMKFQSKKDSPPSIEIPMSSIGGAEEECREKTLEEIEKTKKNISGTKTTQSTKKTKKITRASGGIYLYKTIMNTKIKISKRELKNDIVIDYDCRLQVKNNNWFLLVPFKAKVEEKDYTKKGFCSVDPGVRTFQTIYSEEMVAQVKVNHGLLKKYQNKIDMLKSLRDKKIIKKSSFKRKERRLFSRLNNLIDDLHHKTSTFLTNNFQTILLPPFESQEMAKRNKFGNRNLLQMKHFMFKERLKSKCILKSCNFILSTEEYTTRTCGRCGEINNVGGSEMFHCTTCLLLVDRDVNAARNIGIKKINETLQ
jgi:transposase